MMSAATARELCNGQAIPSDDVPLLTIAEFRSAIIDDVAEGGRIAALFGLPLTKDVVRLIGLLARSRDGMLTILSTDVGHSHPALTPECPQAYWFEREIAEQWAVRPEGHPWLKPIRFHGSYRAGYDAWGRKGEEGSGPICQNGPKGAVHKSGLTPFLLPCVTDYFEVHGEEVHEVAVGPVHAGIIEPGHFRFQCHGEDVFHLEISLGYQHRGVEQALVDGPNRRTAHYMETLAGDTTIGHASAYAGVIEALAKCRVPARAHALRGVALELERLANHAGDLGALAGDVGFLPTAAFCGRIRGDFLNMSAALCGNRFGRGLVRPGGVGFDADENLVAQVLERLDAATRDITVAANLLWDSPSVLARFEGTGAISAQTARDLGLVGVAARACGIERDVRHLFPWGIYQFAHIPVATHDTGDVFARAYVRWLEIQRSASFVREQLAALPAGPIAAPVEPLTPNAVALSLVEGWRGEICHVAVTDEQGRFWRYKVVDPSFRNWAGLAMALRGQQISDFPLCNKSFNLSYCGHDL